MRPITAKTIYFKFETICSPDVLNGQDIKSVALVHIFCEKFGPSMRIPLSCSTTKT
jgi:hypothetical protein